MESVNNQFDVTKIYWCGFQHIYYAGRSICLCGKLERCGDLGSREAEHDRSDEMDFILACIKERRGFPQHCEICGHCDCGDGRTLPMKFSMHGRCASIKRDLLWYKQGDDQREAYRSAHAKQGLCIFNVNEWQPDAMCHEKADKYGLCIGHQSVLSANLGCDGPRIYSGKYMR